MITNIACACCNLTALKVIGNTIQVTLRHNGQYHTTTVPLHELERASGEQALQPLLDRIGDRTVV